MPDLRMAKAELHVKRGLTTREIATIRVALDGLLHMVPGSIEAAAYALYVGDIGLLADEQIRALIHELGVARKVKVCRTKTSSS